MRDSDVGMAFKSSFWFGVGAYVALLFRQMCQAACYRGANKTAVAAPRHATSSWIDKYGPQPVQSSMSCRAMKLVPRLYTRKGRIMQHYLFPIAGDDVVLFRPRMRRDA